MLPSSKYPKKLTVGIDEVGCGCLAGPVVAAGVIWPSYLHDDYSLQINDSKKLSKKKRYLLRDYITDNAIDWYISFIDNNIIDDINIYNARIKAYHNILDNLNVVPEQILIDGTLFKEYTNRFSEIIPYECIISGDNKYQNIAAASILAKCARDSYMKKLCKKYPNYGWHTNMGYSTKQHIKSIKKHGISPYHRKTFGICKSFYSDCLLSSDSE